MLGRVQGLLRQRRRRAAILFAVVLLGAAVVAAHTTVTDDHMGEAAAICLAVVAAGGAVVAALPTPGSMFPRPYTSVRAVSVTTSLVPARTDLNRARGDPSVLQVLRR